MNVGNMRQSGRTGRMLHEAGRAAIGDRLTTAVIGATVDGARLLQYRFEYQYMLLPYSPSSIDIRFQSAEQFIRWSHGGAAYPFVDHLVWESCPPKVVDALIDVVNYTQSRLGYE